MVQLKNKLQILLTVVFVGFVIWWISFQPASTHQDLSNEINGSTYCTVALIGSIIGLVASRKWGGLKTVLGKALLFFALGLLAQVGGQLAYSYYDWVDHIAIPYPSLGDVFYFGSTLLYITAALFLARTAGAKHALKQLTYKIVVVLLPLVLITTAFLVILHNHQYNTAKPLTVFLDAGYPIAEASYISIAILAYLLSRKLLGGVIKSGILLIILALCIQYAADATFVYQADRNTWVAGSYNDLTYLIAYFAMATAMIRFLIIYNKTLDLKLTTGAGQDMPYAQTPAQENDRVINIFGSIAEKIIEQQEAIMGSVAIERAQQVKELHLDWQNHKVAVTGNPQAAIDKLVAEYKVLLGDIAVETCKDASAGFVGQIPPNLLPNSLK